MNDKTSKRRDWVKNAAIVFLSIMLVLTFFSNTIMNYSLPEVATQYVMPGAITAKIRGTGVVESDNPYNVQVYETRTVESVMVTVGSEVQKGDVIFVLADKESDELKAAEEALEAALLEFELQILNGSISSSVVNNVQSGTTSGIAVYQGKITAAEAEISKLEKEIEEIELSISQLNALKNQLDISKPDTKAAEEAYAKAQAAYDADPVKQALDKIAQLNEKIDACQQVIDKYNEKIVIGYEVSGNDQVPIYEVTYKEYLVADTNKNNYIAQRDTQQAIVNDQNAKAVYDNLASELAKAKTNLNNSQNHISNSINAVNLQISNWNLELADRNKKLADANEAKAQLLSDISAELNLGSKMENINELRAEVERLKGKATGAVIEAPIAGTISAINVTAGQNTVAGSAVATIQPAGAGLSMSFSVSSQQASKLTPGMEAELVNSWRYDDVAVSLKRIKPDPSNPSQSKLLEFEVKGSVVAGQTLNVSVGDKSARYDLTIPNSAIREDNNGKFILVVESKSSPLGNRYKATRMDVEVLASDDTTSAIRGALQGYEFVITTSTKPVQAGQLVRLSEQ